MNENTQTRLFTLDHGLARIHFLMIEKRVSFVESSTTSQEHLLEHESLGMSSVISAKNFRWNCLTLISSTRLLELDSLFIGRKLPYFGLKHSLLTKNGHSFFFSLKSETQELE